MKIVIIGGGTAGSELAWRLRRENKEVELTILEQGQYRQYSPCALPYFISGKIKNKENVLLFSESFYQENNIDLRLNSKVEGVDKDKKKVVYRNKESLKEIDYDYLVLATGLKINTLNIPGLKEVSYFSLKTLDDAIEIKKNVEKGDEAVIIGGGYVGVELADALNVLGLKVTLIEAQSQLLSTNFDKKIAQKIEDKMTEQEVKIIKSANIEEIKDKKVKVKGENITYDHLFLACGLSPDFEFLDNLGLDYNKGVLVDDKFKTSNDNIFAIGDLIEAVNLVDKKKTLSQLATTAVSQARSLAKHLLNKKEKSKAVLNASISEFDDLLFASTGLNEKYCLKNNIKTVNAFYRAKDKAEYYPEAKDMYVYILASEEGEILGCQIAGYSEVAGRLNMISLAMQNNLSLYEFVNSETCYNPALSPIFDPLVVAAEICIKKIEAKK